MEEHEPLALVLPITRIAGLAPYDLLQRLRVSRPALVYSYILHLAIGLASLAMHVIVDMNTDIFGYSQLLGIANVTFRQIILWVAVVKGPKKLRDVHFLLTRIKKICRAIKYNHKATRQTKMHWVFMFVALTEGVPVLLSIQAKLLSTKDDESASHTYRIVLTDIFGFFLLFLIMQFVFTAMAINCALRGVNQLLKQLCTELYPDDGLQKNDENYVTVPKNIISGVQFINVKPRMVITFDDRSAHVVLRSLASAYVSTCDLARKLGNASVGLLFQILTFSILTLLDKIYFAITFSGSMNATTDLGSASMFSKSVITCILHISKVVLLVAPCHDLSEELENTRFLVSRISNESSTCSDALRAEVDVFFIHLKVNQPCFSALGLGTVDRSLLLTVAAFVATYLALLLGV